MIGLLRAIAWKAKPRQPMLMAPNTVVTPEHGVAGDFRGAPGVRQVTIVFEDDWRVAGEALGAELPWTHRRANFLVGGLANPRAAGGRLQIGAATFAITGETEPCANMDRQHDGLRAALTPDWRGGLTAQVLAGGRVSVGDAVRWL
jgi:MOSC domain-containing protein YiiM